MFDNPKKELQRLEDQLLAAEEVQWQESWEEGPPQEAGKFLREEDQEELPEEEEPEAPQNPSRTPMLVALLLIEIGVLFAALAWWLLWR
ncbi:MAG: hypothetical protein SO355_10630 [Candidatus Faecousia sp.]|nr:hypothetical protein [Bacillota bacterium]MDY4755775.1 hypothetical protein [Candidatus Faecousia sp.]MDY6159876.1 hypothetical protein [Candidatus Faecousia sp.]